MLVPIILTLGGLIYYDRDILGLSYRLSKALRNARSVSFVEYERDLLLARRAATPEDISRFRRATSPWFMPFEQGRSLCFEPHHRVEIVSADGTKLKFLVCFMCSNFDLYPNDTEISTAADLPPSWEKSLSSFFASIGMPPKSEAEYGELYQKHANDHEMEAQP